MGDSWVFSTTGTFLTTFLELSHSNSYSHREACEMSIIRYPGQRYKGYYTVHEAQDAWEHANAVGNVGPLPATMSAGPSTHTRFDHVLSDEEAHWVVLQGLNPGVYHGL